MKISDWQTGKPPCNGIWEINDHGYVWYARFHNGVWDSGWPYIEQAAPVELFKPYDYNNDANNNIKWWGVIE